MPWFKAMAMFFYCEEKWESVARATPSALQLNLFERVYLGRPNAYLCVNERVRPCGVWIKGNDFAPSGTWPNRSVILSQRKWRNTWWNYWSCSKTEFNWLGRKGREYWIIYRCEHYRSVRSPHISFVLFWRNFVKTKKAMKHKQTENRLFNDNNRMCLYMTHMYMYIISPFTMNKFTFSIEFAKMCFVRIDE